MLGKKQGFWIILLMAVFLGLGFSCQTAAPESKETSAKDADSSIARFKGQSDVPAQTLAQAMKIGWNLGNSLDAVGGEQAWGNPPVSEELIQAIARAGFKTVRIPTTWMRHLSADSSYTIDPAWLDRVEEVVNYVLDAGMVAILNLHHDGAEGVEGFWISLSDENQDVSEEHDAKVEDQLVKIWAQIARRFASYDSRLVFESMNEIHVGYGSPWMEYYASINRWNQSFVRTVRSSGANNATRNLLVPGYNTNIEYTISGFVLPKDSVENHLMISVHFYDPWNFAGAGSSRAWGKGYPGSESWGQEDWVINQFNALKTAYLQKGIPVIMGEYGAVHVKGREKYRRYYMEFVTKAAIDRGIVPVYWDNGSAGSGNDAFGLFDRRTTESLHPETLEAMMRALTKNYSLQDIEKP